MDKPFVIRVSSQKGGVGKTTVAVNVAVTLAKRGFKTLLVDADEANPSVGLHLGFEDAKIGYLDVVRNRAKFEEAMFVHQSGLYVLPGKVVTEEVPTERSHSVRFMSQANRAGYDFVVIDTAPGIQVSGMGYDVDYGLIVTFPSVPACASAVRMSEIFKKHGVRHGLVVNMVTGRNYELHIKEIEEMYNGRAHAVLSEDVTVPRSINANTPACIYKHNSKFSRNIEALASSMIILSGRESTHVPRQPFWHRLLGR